MSIGESDRDLSEQHAAQSAQCWNSAAQHSLAGPAYQDMNVAKVAILHAIYRELRHGHDQQAALTAAIKTMTEAVEQLARRLPTEDEGDVVLPPEG